MERVSQLYSAFGSHFSRPFCEKYGLKRYRDKNSPVVIYGCYGWQIEKAFENKTKVIIVWAGSDLPSALKNPDYRKRLLESTHIRHIARSVFIENDLKRAGLDYMKVPLVPHQNNDISPVPLGDAVYAYKARLYGGAMYSRIKSDYPDFEYIETAHKMHSRQDLIDLYGKCFISFRFTRHDGLSNTAVELGLAGRKIFWNGDTTNAIPWSGYEKLRGDFEEVIRQKKSGEYDPFKVASELKSYLNVGDEWLWI